MVRETPKGCCQIVATSSQEFVRGGQKGVSFRDDLLFPADGRGFVSAATARAPGGYRLVLAEEMLGHFGRLYHRPGD